MNIQDQEKAIAEACGAQPELVEWWAHKADDTGGSICMSAPTRERVEEWIKENPRYAEGYAPKAFYRYPSYSKCLNAMHQILVTLDGNQMDAYRDELKAICWRDWKEGLLASPFAEFTAANQQAEAFLRMFGSWVETPATNKEENSVYS
jgi:hypothetical protein